MSDLSNVTMLIAGVIAIAITFGVITKYNIDRKQKKNKKLSKKQKRELNKV